MLVYLSKKIAIPNNLRLHCISWNREQGWIACGGEQGLLKVLKLETPTGPDAKLQGIAASANLSMNQTLEGHTGGVMCVTWNPLFRKLTTSDENGLIIVWMLHRGMWYEEMINNRNKSVVRDMKWTADGRKIAIVYEDGAVIVGSVDGNRLWGKELTLPLRFVEWSPDGRLLLFVTLEGEVWIYDQDGTKIRSLPLVGQDNYNSLGGEVAITSIHWHASSVLSVNNNYRTYLVHPDAPFSLCIAFDNGKVQLSRGDDDSSAIVLDTDLNSVTYCRWSTKGNIIAIVGTQNVPGTSGKGAEYKSSSGQTSNPTIINLVKFFDNFGKPIRSIRIPGDCITAVSWEGADLRLSLAVDSSIYFANIRHTYTWAYFLNTVVFSYQKSRETFVVFWDLVSSEAHSKLVSNLKFLVAKGDLCAVVISERISGSDVYSIQLRNAIGAVVDCRIVPFAPKFISMSGLHVVAANDRTVFSWQFQSQINKTGLGNTTTANLLSGQTDPSGASTSSSTSKGTAKLKMFDIANTSFSTAQSPETFQILSEAIADPIVCTTISDKYLMIARKGGSITRFNLPHLTVENTYTLSDAREPSRMDFNCTSTKLGMIDSNGIFLILDLEVKSTEAGDPKYSLGPYFGRRLAVERKDVWDMKWSEDDPNMVVIMEKTKMVVFNGETPEEPVVSSGYLARFQDLEIRVVTMDDVMAHPDKMSRDCVVDFESKSLREVRDKVTAEGLQAGYSYADKNPHPRLWKLLATAALEELDLVVAEKAFVRCNDYFGVQLVKQLSTMPDKMKARAEAAVYLNKFDEAEAIYRDIDRKDLAIQLRKRLGDYMKVVQLLQTGGGNDSLVREAWDKIGDYYADRFKWKKAAQYYQQSRNFEQLAECYYRLENFSELAKLRFDLPDDTPLLITLAKRFESVGMYEEAVDCFLRSTRPPKDAVDCCVMLNKWDKALELAERYDYPQVELLLIKSAMSLISSDRKLDAVELFRVANKPTEAAILIGDIAENVANRNVNPALAKKLHVLSALEIERHRKRAIEQASQSAATGTGDIAQTTAATLETLMFTALDTQGMGTNTLGGTLAATLGATLGTMTGGGTMGGGNTKRVSKAFSNAWRGAAAYHYYMLALRQFYSGSMDAAMKTSIKLCEYDDILNPRHIYSLLCLTSLRNKFFGICSKAFVKLETLTNLSEADRDSIQTLAVSIFISNVPSDPVVLPEPYVKCLEVGRSYKACVISGRAIQDSPFHMCKTCRHLMLENELEKNQHLSPDSPGAKLSNCPLCHSPLLIANQQLGNKL